MKNNSIRLFVVTIAILFSRPAFAAIEMTCEQLFISQSIGTEMARYMTPENGVEPVFGMPVVHEGLPLLIVDPRAVKSLQIPQPTAFLDALNNAGNGEMARLARAVYERMHAVPQRRYDVIDTSVVNLVATVHSRLARRMDAHRFVGGYATDVLDVPGVGRVEVLIHQTDDGMTYISTISGPGFRIWNSRATGRQFDTGSRDISFPSEVRIDALNVTIKLYSDDSGIFVLQNGTQYTNSGVRTFGIGRQGDSWKDALHPVVKDAPYGSTNTPEKYQKYVENELRVPFEVSWRSVEHAAADWIETNLTNQVLKMKPIVSQIRTLPRAKEYNQKLGDLYVWLGAIEAKKLAAKLEGKTALKVEDQFAIEPHLRLVPLNEKGDFDKGAYAGFIYLASAKAKLDRNHWMATRLNIRNSMSNFEKDLTRVRVRPKNGEQVYVIDLVSNDTVTIAKSLVPASEYKGDYARPMVLIGRELTLDEVEIIGTETKK